MSEPENATWVGHLSMVRMFEGSMSEGLYPVLDTEDGRRFRVHVKGSQLPDADVLSALMNQRVCLHGAADDLRGHWRLLLDPSFPGEVIEGASVPSTAQDSLSAKPAMDLPKAEANPPEISPSSSSDQKDSR
jgi:hypothetical protein